MKKIKIMFLLATIAMAFSSCEDEYIAYTLEGTWRGNLYISSAYNGYDYDATYSEIEFSRDPYTYSSGTGYWVDYYSGAPWDYMAYHTDWTVRGGIIHIRFLEDGSWIEISDYHLNDRRFWGTIYDGRNRVEFELRHTYSRNWADCRWGYDDWYYYARTRSDNSNADSLSTTAPVRYIRNAD